MAAFRSFLLVLVVSAVMSDALFLGPALTVPVIVGAKIVLVPKAIALKAGIGMLGLKIAGTRYLKEKVVIPASLAGAAAGYKAVSHLMDAPQRIAEAKTLALEKFVHHIPKLPSIPTVPAAPSNFQTTFKVPALPVPQLQWETKTVNVPSIPVPQVQWDEKTVTVPKVVFTEPQSKTITITKHTEPAAPAYPVPQPAAPAYAVPEPPTEEVVDRPRPY